MADVIQGWATQPKDDPRSALSLVELCIEKPDVAKRSKASNGLDMTAAGVIASLPDSKWITQTNSEKPAVTKAVENETHENLDSINQLTAFRRTFDPAKNTSEVQTRGHATLPLGKVFPGVSLEFGPASSSFVVPNASPDGKDSGEFHAERMNGVKLQGEYKDGNETKHLDATISDITIKNKDNKKQITYTDTATRKTVELEDDGHGHMKVVPS